MGISGLLPVLKSIHKPSHLRDFAGQTIGVDAYGWLHRGTIACAIDLAQGKPTRKHIDFTLNKVRMLIHFGVKPYLVFDGDYLPSKTHTEKGRAARRRESKKVGLELLRMGRLSQAQLELQKAIDVTPTMARELIEELKQLDVSYVVAPYEADSQLAYLEKQGIISGILSEDSDMLVFGVKCLLTKLDPYGECVMIKRDHFTACKEINLVGWSDREFRIMAMLSGCDYLAGIGGMGLKTAHRLVRKHKTVERVVRTVQFDGKMKVPPGYLESFSNAERTFLYQWVFCPEAGCLKNLVELPANLKAEDMPFIGKHVEPEIAAGVACGDLDPNTKQPIILPPRIQRPLLRASPLQTPDGKGGKPINDYFRASRVPLAELDINSFTPSPSQVRLLESQRNASWSATPVTAPQPRSLQRFNTIQAPASAAPAFRRVASESCLRNRNTSPKRQRLCSDGFSSGDIFKDDEDQESIASPFFGAQSTQASPSLHKKSNNNKKEEFELWSDDSAAEALAAATATPMSTQTHGASSPRKRKKLGVFTDSPGEDSGSAEDDTSQSTIASAGSVESHYSESVLTPDTPLSSFSSTSHSIFSQGIRDSFDSLNAKNTARFRKVYSSAKRSVSLGGTRLGALYDSQNLTTSGMQKAGSEEAEQEVVATNSNSAQRESVSKQGSEQSVEEHTSYEDLMSESVHLAGLSRSLRVKGSEDLLVPSSPEDSAEEAGGIGQKLQFSKFAFAG